MDSVTFTGLTVARSVKKAPPRVQNLINSTAQEVASFADREHVNVRYVVKDASWTTKMGQYIHIGDRLYMFVDKKRQFIPDFLMNRDFCKKIHMLFNDPINVEEFKQQVFDNIKKYNQLQKTIATAEQTAQATVRKLNLVSA